MKSFKIKFVPIDEKGDWIQSDSTIEMDVVAEDENKAIIDAVTRMVASYDVWDDVAKKLTVKSDEEERYARITVSENDKLVISTLIVKIGT